MKKKLLVTSLLLFMLSSCANTVEPVPSGDSATSSVSSSKSKVITPKAYPFLLNHENTGALKLGTATLEEAEKYFNENNIEYTLLIDPYFDWGDSVSAPNIKYKIIIPDSSVYSFDKNEILTAVSYTYLDNQYIEKPKTSIEIVGEYGDPDGYKHDTSGDVQGDNGYGYIYGIDNYQIEYDFWPDNYLNIDLNLNLPVYEINMWINGTYPNEFFYGGYEFFTQKPQTYDLKNGFSLESIIEANPEMLSEDIYYTRPLADRYKIISDSFDEYAEIVTTPYGKVIVGFKESQYGFFALPDTLESYECPFNFENTGQLKMGSTIKEVDKFTQESKSFVVSNSSYKNGYLQSYTNGADYIFNEKGQLVCAELWMQMGFAGLDETATKEDYIAKFGEPTRVINGNDIKGENAAIYKDVEIIEYKKDGYTVDFIEPQDNLVMNGSSVLNYGVYHFGGDQVVIRTPDFDKSDLVWEATE